MIKANTVSCKKFLSVPKPRVFEYQTNFLQPGKIKISSLFVVRDARLPIFVLLSEPQSNFLLPSHLSGATTFHFGKNERIFVSIFLRVLLNQVPLNDSYTRGLIYKLFSALRFESGKCYMSCDKAKSTVILLEFKDAHVAEDDVACFRKSWEASTFFFPCESRHHKNRLLSFMST